MKKILLLLITCLFVLSTYAQKVTKGTAELEIENTITNFLTWYKANEAKLQTSAIIRGYNPDTVKKDSLLRIDMNSVDEYLSNFNRSNYVSNIFLAHLRSIYKSVADTLKKYPTYDYFGPVPGLECDLLLGFEPELVLDHISKGRLSKVYIINNKALVRFNISKFIMLKLVLTKGLDGKWLIDDMSYDTTKLDRAFN